MIMRHPGWRILCPRLVESSSVRRTPSQLKPGVRSISSNDNNSEKPKSDEAEAKPDLRNSAGKLGNPKAVVLVCILAAVCMYPMIFRPLFGFESLDEDKSNEIRSEIAKHRPENMPGWTSPFGPKKAEDQ